MKAPVCENCAESGLLCTECNGKLENGTISNTDISISKVLFKLERQTMLRDVEFTKSVHLDGFVLMFTKGEIAPLIGKGGRVVRMISEKAGKKIRIIAEGDIKSMIQDLVHPARVLSVNVLYKKDSEEYSVTLSKNDQSKIVMNQDILLKGLEHITQKKVNLKYK